MRKRIFAMLLAAALCLGIICTFIPSALAFSDIYDTKTAEAAELLRLLGVMQGTGSGAFVPGGTLDRASFCKMALEVSGRGKEALAHANRGVFRDVKPSHWALGYVNAAASPSAGGAALIRGRGDDYFYPDDPITFAEAVTILMRMLGYSDKDVGAGATWYSGYLASAARAGLTEGLARAGDANLKRGEAAQLFESLLFTELKDSTSIYLTVLGGSVTENAVVLSTSATSDDGTTGSVKTSLGTYKTDRMDFSSDLEGVRGKLVLDESGKLLAVTPEKSDTLRSVGILSCNADHVIAHGGERLSVALDTTVWEDGKTTTYESVWAGLRAGTRLVFCYNGSGKLDYILIASSASSEGAIVAKNLTLASSAFPALAGGRTDYSVFKNGAAATMSDLRQYDVGVYDRAANAIYISDLRLTGVYENAYPNSSAPSTVTVAGAQFDLLPGAVSDLKSFALGDSVTLLMTHTMQVAGVLSPNTVRSTAVGVARISGDNVSVTLLGGQITLSGKTTLSPSYRDSLDGQLVAVTYSSRGYLSLSPITGGSVTSSLNVAAGTVGGRQLASNAVIYEQAGSGALSEIKLDDILRPTVPSSKISFVEYDYAGRISYMVLSDVTGDRYQYGYFVYTSAVPGAGMDAGTNATVAVRYAGAGGTETMSAVIETGISVSNAQPGGLALTPGGKVAAHVSLSRITGLSRTDFDLDRHTVSHGSNEYFVWKDVQCYNKTTGSWYAPGYSGLSLALAFSDNIVIYFDRAPEEGGKIRLVEVY